MKSYKYLLILLVLSAAALLFITSCDDRTMEPETYILSEISVEPDLIYLDDGITYSEISVSVKNDEGFAVTGQEVNFRANYGNIIYSVYTDSTGIAHSTFWDGDDINEDELPLQVTVEAFAGGSNKSGIVTIEQQPEIDSINVIAPQTMKAGKQATVKATAYDAMGPVAYATLIRFDTDAGHFVNSEGTNIGTTTQIQTTNGVAEVLYKSEELIGSGTATITCSASGETSSKEITIIPGNPFLMTLESDTNSITIDPPQTAEVTASITDSYGNPIEGETVAFTSTIGNIQSFASTLFDGTATVTFSPGVQAGLAEITASTDSLTATTNISVQSNQVYSMQFAFPGKIDINLLGTGGNESAEIVVNLFDSNGNLIDDNDDLDVYFKFETAPIPQGGDIGANINNTVYYPSTESVVVQPENGQAVVSVSSGTNPGTIGLKAYTFRDTTEISATKSNIVVHSGHPNSIELTIGDVDSAEEMGGGVWQIECAAIINDAWGNPVDYGSAVWFSLLDGANPTVDPDWATIGAEAYVGNENAGGDSLSGIAYTFLNYEGAHTNDSLWVKVQVASSDSNAVNGVFIDSTLVIMPIQFAQIDLVATPSHIDWTETNNPPYQYTTVQILVQDGQNNPINGQRVYVTSTPGTPVTGPNSTTASYLSSTGLVNGQNGMIHKSVLFYKYECTPPGLNPPGTTDAVIVATILGTGITGDVTVRLNRYFD